MACQEQKKEFDVIVVGAGPSGSSLGYLLAEKGLDVLVIDREKFPRPKLCGGAITWKTRKLLEKIFGVPFEKQFSVEHISDEYYLYEKFRERVHQRSSEPFNFVNREKYDMELVSLAERKGCQFLFGEKVIDLDLERNSIRTHLGTLLSGKVIVGADGVNSIIRKRAFPQENYSRYLGLAFQIEVPKEKIKDKYQHSAPRIFTGVANHGYGWIFPNKKTYLVGLWGLIRKDKRLKDEYKLFLENTTKLNSEEISLRKSNLILSGTYMRDPGLNRILIVGDAGGFVDPLTGEGIYYAHKTAELAAMSILNYLNSDEDVDLVQKYKDLLDPVYQELLISRRIANFAYSRLRALGYFFVKSPKFYDRVAEIVHGLKSYSQVPFFSIFFSLYFFFGT